MSPVITIRLDILNFGSTFNFLVVKLTSILFDFLKDYFEDITVCFDENYFYINEIHTIEDFEDFSI